MLTDALKVKNDALKVRTTRPLRQASFNEKNMNWKRLGGGVQKFADGGFVRGYAEGGYVDQSTTVTPEGQYWDSSLGEAGMWVDRPIVPTTPTAPSKGPVFPEEVKQELLRQGGGTLEKNGVIYQADVSRGTEQDQGGQLQGLYSYKADDNKTGGIVRHYDTDTGAYEQATRQQKVPSFAQGFAEAAAMAAPIFAPGLGNALGGALGLSGATAGAVGSGLISAGLTKASGADWDDALKAGLIAGGGKYLGSMSPDIGKTIAPNLSEASQKAIGNAATKAALTAATGGDVSRVLANAALGYGVGELADKAGVSSDALNTASTALKMTRTDLGNPKSFASMLSKFTRPPAKSI